MKQERLEAILESVTDTLEDYDAYLVLGGVAIRHTTDDALRTELDALASSG